MTVPGETNPWLSQPAIPATSQPLVVDEPTALRAGPLAPQRGVVAPDRADQLPVISHNRTASLWLVGAHGGAGESSLAALVPDWAPADHGWPRTRNGTPVRVVVTARSSAAGLQAAQHAARHWASGEVPHVELLGLVVVADAPGKLPRPLRELQQLVAGGFPRTWNVPWIESWRLGATPDLTASPREVRRLVDELTTLLRPGAPGAAN